MPQRQAGDIGATYQDAPTKSINVGGTRFVYRRLGADAGVPVIFLHHLGAVLDNWDPRVVDGIAAKHPVVTFDNRGVGASEGQTPDTVTTMADDAIAFVRALGFDQVDLLGFSLGGFVAQVIAQQEPQLVRKIILAGTGPAGGVGIGKVTFGTIRESIKATLTFRDPKELRFFTRTDSGKSAARQFVKRLKERKDNRDKSITVRAFRSQLKAIHAWGTQKPSDLTSIGHPVLIANGDDDTMVPTSNSLDLADRLPDATLRIYPDAGHGGIFQHHESQLAADSSAGAVIDPWVRSADTAKRWGGAANPTGLGVAPDSANRCRHCYSNTGAASPARTSSHHCFTSPTVTMSSSLPLPLGRQKTRSGIATCRPIPTPTFRSDPIAAR